MLKGVKGLSLSFQNCLNSSNHGNTIMTLSKYNTCGKVI